MPDNSDAREYYDLFTTRQICSLALLHSTVMGIQDRFSRCALLLAWSAALGKLNRTFLSAEGRAKSRGGSSIFSIYRYKLAKSPVELPPWKVFHERALNVIEAKKEIDKILEVRRRTKGSFGRFEVDSCDVVDLAKRLKGKVDYIFTDPPYGGHIAYLDLSILWTHWLGLKVSSTAKKKEIIVGGEEHFSEQHYIKRLGDGVRACAMMLKRER